MPFVVMLERHCQIAHGRRGVRFGHEGDVVALHGLHEALGHTVTLRTAHWSGERRESDTARKRTSLVRNISRAVIV